MDSKINKNSVSIAGGKGASLGEMTQAGLAVPPGFVVLAGMFDRFVQESDIIEDIQAELEKVKAKVAKLENSTGKETNIPS